MNNTLIVCPDCAKTGDTSILGAIKPDDSIELHRWRKGKGMQKIVIHYKEQLTLVCQCGFGTTIHNFRTALSLKTP